MLQVVQYMNLKWNAQVFVAFEETVYSHSLKTSMWGELESLRERIRAGKREKKLARIVFSKFPIRE